MTMRAIEALVAAVLAAERERCAMSESLARPFRCSECGTRVASARPRPDATWEVRHGVSMSLPDDVLVPTCEHCGEEISAATWVISQWILDTGDGFLATLAHHRFRCMKRAELAGGT